MLLGLQKIILLILVTIQSVYSKLGGSQASTFMAGRKHQVPSCSFTSVILRPTHLAANERCPEKKSMFAKVKLLSSSALLRQH